MCGASASLAKGSSGSWKGILGQLLELSGKRRFQRSHPIVHPCPPPLEMLAARKISTQEATAKRCFARSAGRRAYRPDDRGGNHGEIFREPEPGPVRGADPCCADRGLP